MFVLIVFVGLFLDVHDLELRENTVSVCECVSMCVNVHEIEFVKRIKVLVRVKKIFHPPRTIG